LRGGSGETMSREGAIKVLRLLENDSFTCDDITQKASIAIRRARGREDELDKVNRAITTLMLNCRQSASALPIENRPHSPIASDQSSYPSHTLNQVPLGNWMVIAAHGGIMEEFTLIPENYKLILPSSTGQELIFHNEHQTQIQQDGQPIRFSLYSGLISQHTLDWDMTHNLSEGNQRDHINANYAGVYNIDISDSFQVDSPLTTKHEELILKKIREGTLNNMPVSDFEVCFPISGKRSDAAPACKPAWPGHPTSAAQTADTKLDLYTEQILMKHDGNIIHKGELKRAIKNKQKFGGSRENDIQFKLSQVLKHIENNPSSGEYPTTIFGFFCRAGKYIDMEELMRCDLPGIENLSGEYFSDNIDYGSFLTRGRSLASKSKAQNFWAIYNKIKNNIHEFNGMKLNPSTVIDGAYTNLMGRFKIVQEKIETTSAKTDEHGIYNGISLTKDDVCLIFLMDDQLIKKGI